MNRIAEVTLEITLYCCSHSIEEKKKDGKEG